MMASSDSEDAMMSSTYSRCLVLRAPNVSLATHLGQADDVGERRAQLVGDVLDEVGLQPVGRLQRLVALLQDALDAGRIGDVDEGQHRHAFRQRHGRIVDDAAVGAVHAAGDRLVVVEVGDGGADVVPGLLVRIDATADPR